MHPYPAPGAAPPPVPGCTWDRARAGARRGTNAGTVWALHARPGPEPGTSLVAYCGADGDVAVGGLPLASRYRLPHRPVAGAARRPRACAAACASAPVSRLTLPLLGVRRPTLIGGEAAAWAAHATIIKCASCPLRYRDGAARWARPGGQARGAPAGPAPRARRPGPAAGGRPAPARRRAGRAVGRGAGRAARRVRGRPPGQGQA